MSTPFFGEIRLLGGNFPPKGWAFCNGQLLPIMQNTALFSLLGTTFGGDGIHNFALPNLQDRFPVGFGQGPGLSNRELGETGGQAAVSLTSNQIPAHSHALNAALSPTTGTPGATVSLASTSTGAPAYRALSSPRPDRAADACAIRRIAAAQQPSAGNDGEFHHRDARRNEFVLLDIALLPEARGRGIGSWCLVALLAEARATGAHVRLRVDPASPAPRLYARFGFEAVAVAVAVAVADHALHREMRWQPAVDIEGDPT